MGRIITLFATGLLVGTVMAQAGRTDGQVPEHIAALRAAGTPFTAVPLLHPVPQSLAAAAPWKQDLDHATVLRLDPARTAQVLAQRPASLALELPSDEGTVTLDLERVEITSDDFTVLAASTNAPVDYHAGVHYRGMVRGDNASVAAISVFGDEVMGLIVDAQGDRVLGRLAGNDPTAHVLYRASALKHAVPPHCDTPDDGTSYTADQLTIQPHAKTAKCVRLYWEVNYDIFQGKGSVTNATNYVTGLFNQSATLYANDGISVTLSQVYVWDVASPYTATSTSDLLTQFGTNRTSFNGDLAALLGYAGGGGIAWLTGLCNSQAKYKMAYCGISSSFSNVPTYSWSVEVVTHEQGHLLGSKHTHACAWNGNNTAIDGCGPAAGYTEGTCAAGPVPSSTVGGTIMSYCHLVSAGIKFANGFGPQPLAVIINNINNAACLTACTGGSCGTPTGLAASSITTSGATLAWTAVTGATSYTLQWKATSASTWTTVSGLTTTSYALSGLAASTGYSFQVLAVCASGSSAYATAVSFTTAAAATCGVPTGLTASSITTSGAMLNWTAVSGATSYTLRYKTTAGSTWTTVTGITTTSRAVTGLTAGTAYDAQVLTVCSSGSSAYTATTNFTTTAASCGLPTGLVASAITTSGATLSWSAVSGATSYSLRYKASSASTWTTLTGITTTSRAITGLTAATAYDAQVLAVCSVGSSAYTATSNFTTSAAGCSDIYEPNNNTSTAHAIAANGTITGLISSSTDKDWFTFANTAAQPNIRIDLTNLPGDYDVRLYRGNTLLATSQNGSTTAERITYNTSTVSTSYRIKVYGYNGANSTSQCYTLAVQTSATAFAMPAASPEAAKPELDIEEQVMHIYPNPARDQVNILVPGSEENTTIELLDGLGRVVSSFTQGAVTSDSTVQLDVSDRPNGVYLVRVTQGEASGLQRLVVAH